MIYEVEGADCNCPYKNPFFIFFYPTHVLPILPLSSFPLGGCQIVDPPPEGYKCKCKFDSKGFCEGEAVKCDSEKCPPTNCKTLDCCEMGEGNCGGYCGFECLK